MQVLRKVFFSVLECKWFAGYWDSTDDTWEYPEIPAGTTIQTLVQLETNYPFPAFSMNEGYAFLPDIGKAVYQFDPIANPS